LDLFEEISWHIGYLLKKLFAKKKDLVTNEKIMLKTNGPKNGSNLSRRNTNNVEFRDEGPLPVKCLPILF